MKNILIAIFLLAAYSTSAHTTDDKETLKRLNQSVVSSYQNQKFDDALKFAQQALNLSLRTNGEDSNETAAAYKIVGSIYREKAKYKNSLENLQKAFEIYRRNPTPNQKNLFEIHSLLALSQSLGGMKKEAEASYLKAIETGEAAFGQSAKENLQPLSALAAFYAQADDEEKAHEYYLKSYALALKHFGENGKELEALKISEAFYSRRVMLAKDRQFDEYFKKKGELFGYEAARVIDLPAPVYSDRARAERRQGKIVVKVFIDERGRATGAKAVFGEMFFASSVEEAARSARYKPAVATGGKPVGSVLYITQVASYRHWYLK